MGNTVCFFKNSPLVPSMVYAGKGGPSKKVTLAQFG
jgi:hypothetical protein